MRAIVPFPAVCRAHSARYGGKKKPPENPAASSDKKKFAF
jgi:hypothetical protein